jgi:pimeloyl-ACP methyl ester carboxylesterase
VTIDMPDHQRRPPLRRRRPGGSRTAAPTRTLVTSRTPARPRTLVTSRTLALSLLCLALLGVASAAVNPMLPPGSVLEVAFEERLSVADVQRNAASGFGRFGPPSAHNPVDVYRLQFVTTGLQGASTVVAARLFVPVDPIRERMPLFVFGSGTTGLGDVCAPSREHLLPQPEGDYGSYLPPYAANGIVTIFPDYLGFEDPSRPQAYFHAVSEATVMLDAARAAKALFQANPDVLGRLDGTVVAGGYSQGGHAAFAAADAQGVYAPSVELAGLIGFGASIDVRALLIEGPFYAPYVVTSFAHVYGRDLVNPSEILASRWLPTLEQTATSVCVSRAQQVYPFDVDAMYTPAFAAALRSGTLAREFPSFDALLAANRPGFSGHGLPALVIQGDQDVIVRNGSQERTVQDLCAAGSPVLYLNMPGVRHRDTRPAGFEAAVAYIFDRADGVAPPSSCTDW